MNKETKKALLQKLANMQKSTPDGLKQKMKDIISLTSPYGINNHRSKK